MKTPRNSGTEKRRGRPATGQGMQIGTRWSEITVKAIDGWAALQSDKPGRSEAIRRLVELGLTVNASRQVPSSKASARAAEMAEKAIEKQLPADASVEERAARKRKLLHGPSIVRDIRADRPKK